MLFGQLCKTKANHISDSGTGIYINNVGMCAHTRMYIHIFKRAVIFTD